MRFLSDRNIEMHKEYLNTLILKYSIFEKSYPELKGLDINGIYRVKLPLSEREAAARLYAEIQAHKLYFSSFSERNLTSDRIKREYGSVPSFLYFLSEECKKVRQGFLFVCDSGKRISVHAAEDCVKLLRSERTVLALDLCEHAYFYDYGFEKDKYVLNAISHFDLGKIEKSAN